MPRSCGTATVCTRLSDEAGTRVNPQAALLAFLGRRQEPEVMAASTAHSMTPLPAPPPALAPATVMRPRLERRLDACTARPVTVVTAPAGFGKTLLLASWAARNGAAWLQLHPVHCDVARLWRDVAHALQTLGLEASVDLPGPAALACRVHLRPDDPPQPRRTLVLDDL